MFAEILDNDIFGMNSQEWSRMLRRSDPELPKVIETKETRIVWLEFQLKPFVCLLL